MTEPALKAWKLPFIVSAIAVSIVLGFYLGGPGLGLAVGGLAAGTIVVMAIRHPPRPAIVPPLAADYGRHVLVVLALAIDDAAAGEVARLLDAGGGVAAEALLISPCRSRFLDRWACDLDGGKHSAQQSLVLSAATLAKAGIHATARVGDEDLVQMTEDVLRTYPATEVVLVGGGERDPHGEQAEIELRDRLRVPFRAIQPSSAVRSRRPTSSEARVFSSS